MKIITHGDNGPRDSDEVVQRAGISYRALVERVPAVVYVDDLNEDGSAVYVSPRIRDLVGYTPEEWVSDRGLWAGCVHPEDRGRVVAQAVRARRCGEPFEAEYRMLARDGSVVWVRDEAAPVADGGRVRWQGVLLDVTESKRVEEALRESEERFRITFEAAAVGMAHVAPDGRWMRVNRRLCEVVGYPREELLGLTFQDITHHEDLDKDLEHVRRMLVGEIDEYSMEKRYLKKDRSRVWISLTVSMVRGASGEPDYFVSVVEDITERKLMELVAEPLTPRELEVLVRVARGRMNQEIAGELSYSVGTVKLHVGRILAKLGVKNRAGAAARAVDIGLIPPQRR